MLILTNPPFCNNEKEDINYLFKQCLFYRDISYKIAPQSPTSMYSNMEFVEWLKTTWNNGKAQRKIFIWQLRRYGLQCGISRITKIKLFFLNKPKPVSVLKSAYNFFKQLYYCKNIQNLTITTTYIVSANMYRQAHRKKDQIAWMETPKGCCKLNYVLKIDMTNIALIGGVLETKWEVRYGRMLAMTHWRRHYSCGRMLGHMLRDQNCRTSNIRNKK